MPVIGCMADNGHFLYSFGAINLYLPFPKPLTGSIKSAFFSFVMRFPAAVTESFAIVPWLAFSRSIATSIAIFSSSTVILFLGAGYKPVKITLILPILNDTVFLKLTLGKGFCNGCCHFSFMMQHFFLVKLQKRIQPCDPILSLIHI